MNRSVTSAFGSAFGLALASVAAVACGGSSKGTASPAVPGDVCMVGVHASGVTGRAATWDAVGAFVGASGDELCRNSPCGPDEPFSFVGGSGLAIKVDGGYTVLGEVWEGVNAPPSARIAQLDGLIHVALDEELLGRDEVELDDGETTTATVSLGRAYTDLVVDPAAGKVLWRAHCAVEGDASSHAPTVTRRGDTFGYAGCTGNGPTVTFTAAQASECPAE